MSNRRGRPPLRIIVPSLNLFDPPKVLVVRMDNVVERVDTYRLRTNPKAPPHRSRRRTRVRFT